LKEDNSRIILHTHTHTHTHTPLSLSLSYILYNKIICYFTNLQRAYIKSIGGTNVIDAVKRTLYKLFSNKLAEKFNWKGRCGKEPLRKLELI